MNPKCLSQFLKKVFCYPKLIPRGFCALSGPFDFTRCSRFSWSHCKIQFYLTFYFVCFVCRFPSLLPFDSAVELEELSQEFNDYLPLDESEFNQGCKDEQKADTVWNQLGNMRRRDGQLRFQRLARVAKLVLTMPHSNAADERVFSMIRKNKTPFRPNLDPSETLGSIITIKMELEQQDPSRKFVFPPQLLSAAKSARRKYNMLHSWTISTKCISLKQFFLWTWQAVLIVY